MLCLAVQELIYPKLNDVLSDLCRYYEWKKVTILAREKNTEIKYLLMYFIIVLLIPKHIFRSKFVS